MYGPFYRTYTGHEDLWMFGLLNANARLYSPYMGRFVSPDPLLNEEGGPLDYNPYVYARNNPYKYIDRNGEFGALVALGLVGLIGGGLNVWANWDNINSAGDFFMFFGVGAVSGVVGAAAVAMAPAGFFAGAFYGAVGGGLSNAILGGGNAAILGQDVGSAMFTGAWQGAATGFVLGGATGYFSAKANGLNGWTGMEKSNVMATRHRPLMTEPDAMPGHPSADIANSTPINYEHSAVQFSAYQKGEMGKLRRMNEIVQDGGKILGTEVTIEVNGIRIRPDIVYRNKEGLLVFSEVKNGSYTRFTTNQGKAIPIMRDEHPFIIPKGRNATQIPAFKKVIINNKPYMGDYGIEVIRYFDPF